MTNDTPEKEKLCSAPLVRYDVNGTETWFRLPDAILTVTEEEKGNPLRHQREEAVSAL